ncbi:MAG: DUF5717 family protein [Lachnospiraceae bacterium]|nr:DUF5717 family protein [Lachnospiraceae bacterium]
MQEVIRKILDGDYTTGSKSLNFSCSKIEIQVAADCDFEGSFHVYCAPGTETDGFVTTTDSRMECINYAVVGSDTEISYHFHGDLCSAGDVIKGAFCIVSNHGEYYLPYVVNVEQPVLYSSDGPIRNLFAYTNLAKNNWKEAVKLFYSPEFVRIFDSSEENFLEIYKALDDSSGNEQNVEEFLISVGKKQKVEFLYNKKTLNISLMGRDLSAPVVESEVEIVKNGWGYTGATVYSEQDFIFPEKSVLTEEDFLGNACILKVFIDPRMCRNGIHTGRIIVESPFSRLEIPVEVKSKSTTLKPGNIINRSKNNYMYQLTREYVDHSLGKMSDADWIKKSGKLVELMAAMDDEDFYAKLYQARILVLQNRMNEAGWLVDRAGELIDHAKRQRKLSDEALAIPVCYHWLMAAMVTDEAGMWRQAAEKVEAIYKRNRKNWNLGIIALKLPTSYSSSVSSRWNLLEYLFNQGGCTSPVVYAEAIGLINENATVVRQVDSFALQVIACGARYDAFNPLALEQIIFLAGRVREYSPVFLKALITLYENHEDKRLLQEICSQLIKGQRQDAKAFEWYSKAVEAEIRLTNLYEYYVFSIDTEQGVEIPRSVLLYFSCQNSLDYERMAYIYHYIIALKDLHPDIYESNLKNIEEFANNQMRKHHINRDLSVIYENFLNPESIDSKVAEGMSDILFSYWISCRNKKYTKAFVYQKGCAKPWEYNLKDGCGYISVYGSGGLVAFGDSSGNLYLGSAEYTVKKMMNSGIYMPIVSEYVWDNTRLNAFLIGVGQDGSIQVTSENIRRFMQLAESSEVSADIRVEMLMKAMDYYLLHEEVKELERCLSIIDLERLTPSRRKQVFDYLMVLGKYDTIIDWIRKYGPYFTSEENIRKYLEKVITPRSDRKEYRPEEAITNAAIYAFRAGHCGTVIAEYLSKHYRGMSSELRDIWKSLVEYGLPTNELEQKLLIQLLFTGTYLPERYEITSKYISENPETRLTRALIAQGAFEYFAGKGKADDGLMEIISKYAAPGAKLPKAIQLAFLKYYAANPDKLNDHMRKLVLIFLKQQMDERIYLGFFRDYLKPGVFPDEEQHKKLEAVLEVLADRTIIDYKAKPGKVARINYMLTQGDEEQGEYSTEYMRDVCGGVCFKDFVIFFGESLQYYITEEDGEAAKLSESGTIQNNEAGAGSNGSRFDMINNLLVSETMKDYARFDSLLEDYTRQEFMNSELFKLM